MHFTPSGSLPERRGPLAAHNRDTALDAEHGVKIEPAFIPVFKATLRDLEGTIRLRQDATPKQPEAASRSFGSPAEALIEVGTDHQLPQGAAGNDAGSVRACVQVRPQENGKQVIATGPCSW